MIISFSSARCTSVALVLVGATACSSPPDAKAAAPAGAPAGDMIFSAVESTTVAAPLLVPSQVYVERDAVIATRAAGVLRTLRVDLGTVVKAGAELGRVDDDAQRLAQSRAEVALARARKIAWRAQEMRNSNNIPVSEAEDAEFALREAEVAKREADLALERTTLVAPFDGVVTGRYVQPGRLLTLNDSVVRITARGPWLARARLPERDADALQVGSSVRVWLAPPGDGEAARSVRGAVRRLSPLIDAGSGTREAIVQLEPGGRAILSGQAVTIEVPRGERRTLTVPRGAVTADGYVVVQTGRRRVMRPVIVGDTIGDRVEIRGGLVAGDLIGAPAVSGTPAATPSR